MINKSLVKKAIGIALPLVFVGCASAPVEDYKLPAEGYRVYEKDLQKSPNQNLIYRVTPGPRGDKTYSGIVPSPLVNYDNWPFHVSKLEEKFTDGSKTVSLIFSDTENDKFMDGEKYIVKIKGYEDKDDSSYPDFVEVEYHNGNSPQFQTGNLDSLTGRINNPKKGQPQLNLKALRYQFKTAFKKFMNK